MTCQAVNMCEYIFRNSNQTKTVGNSKQGPGFAAVRGDQKIGPRRTAYNELRATLTSIPELTGNFGKEEILGALVAWEADAANANKLKVVPDSDATSMLGWNCSNVIRQCVQFVLIPASISISGEVGTASKGTKTANWYVLPGVLNPIATLTEVQ